MTTHLHPDKRLVTDTPEMNSLVRREFAFHLGMTQEIRARKAEAQLAVAMKQLNHITEYGYGYYRDSCLGTLAGIKALGGGE